MDQYSRVAHHLLFGALFLLAIIALHPRVAMSKPLGDQNRPNPTNPFPGGVAARDPLSTVTRLSGTLMVQWGDPIDAQAEALVLYDFFTEDGIHYRLDGDSLRRAYGGNPQSLHRQSVMIAVREAVPGLRPGSDHAVQVQTIQPNPAQDRGTDAPRILEGSLPYISVLCAFPDGEAPFRPFSFYENMYGNSYPFLDHYWREQSYDTISVAGSDVIGPFTMPHSQAYYGYEDGFPPDLDGLANDCLAAVESSVDFTIYHGINLMFNHWSPAAWGGGWCGVIDGGEVCSPMTWLADWAWSHLSIIEHEMGHSFGLPHSNDQYGNEYGNAWDVMSGGYCQYFDDIAEYGCLGVHTIAQFKAALGWIPSSKIFDAVEGSNQGIRIERLALPAGGGYQMARIPHLSRVGYFYTLEARRLVGHDIGLPMDGIVIHQVLVNPDYLDSDPGWARVVDGDGDGETWDDGAAWTVGETFSDPKFGVSVTVISADATGYTVDIDLAPPAPFTGCSDQDSIPVDECLALVALHESTAGVGWGVNSGWLNDFDPCYWAYVTCTYNPESAAAPQYNVTALQLGSNNLSGLLPAELGNLDKLRDLSLSANQLSGSLPVELGNIENLEYLDLGYNQFSGPIPPELGNLDKLRYLYLYNNQLTGSLPAEFGDLKNLISMYLANNQLNGPLLAELGNLDKLTDLTLNDNQLSGPLPVELGNLGELNWLNLSGNQLSGSLPAELGNLKALIWADLSGNQLSGPLPAALGNLDDLGYLFLTGNQLSGPLPAALGNLENLEYLYLGYNQFSGPLPANLGNLGSLMSLELFENQFSGPIPPEFGNLESLEHLHLSGNDLSGSLPAELGNLDSLKWLMVSDNPLSGRLRRELTQLNLELFDFSATGLCEPTDSEIQIWLESILFLNRTGLECVPSLQVDFTDGAPGSYFHINGVVFAPNVNASVSANGVEIGAVQTDANGDLAFRLSTAAADEGFYEIRVVAGDDQAAVSILLDSAAPARPLSGTAPEIALPAGIIPHRLFLPFITGGP